MRHVSCAASSGWSTPATSPPIVNTGDDTELHGLHIAPDLDTITYTLAEAIDPERGWGLAGETWNAMAALDRYAVVRPPGSVAAPTWFNLGDRDLATHLFRTARLGEGATLTEVTAEITRAWGLDVSLLPMTDDRLRTMVTVAGHGEIGFQDYFVRLRHDVEVEAVRFDHDGATLSAPARTALETADVVVIAPSNPHRVDRADPRVARRRRAARRAPRVGRRRLADRRRRRP